MEDGDVVELSADYAARGGSIYGLRGKSNQGGKGNFSKAALQEEGRLRAVGEVVAFPGAAGVGGLVSREFEGGKSPLSRPQRVDFLGVTAEEREREFQEKQQEVPIKWSSDSSGKGGEGSAFGTNTPMTHKYV